MHGHVALVHRLLVQLFTGFKPDLLTTHGEYRCHFELKQSITTKTTIPRPATPRQHLGLRADGPDAHEIIGETTEQRLAISGPGKGHTLWFTPGLASVGVFRLEFVDNRPE